MDDDINLKNIQNYVDESNICTYTTQIKEEIDFSNVEVVIEEDNIGKY